MTRRRSLTHVGGEVETAGNREVAAALAAALDVRAGGHERGRGDDPDRVHVHGFHSYPARMHPATAARLVRAALGGAAATVLDPFCGSGTVLVEAMIAGRRAIGTDLNPLAVRLATLKTTPRDRHRARGRSSRRPAASRRSPTSGASGAPARRVATRPRTSATFDPHVLLELDSLRAGISDTGDAARARGARARRSAPSS